jgi:5'-nucleotidase
MRSQCEQSGDQVVTVDLGDHMDRMSSLTEASWGQANIEVMNLTGYDLAAIGNNEGLTFPKDRLMKLYEDARFKVICNNLLEKQSQQAPEFLNPYVLQTKNDFRIGWISVTAPFQTFYNLLGWQVLDPLVQVEKALKEIRDHVDLIIVLSHLGYGQDQRIAKQFPEINIIIGAHTHDLLVEGEKINNTFIIQAGKFGQYIGRTTVEYDPKTKNIEAIYGRCYESLTFDKDVEVERAMERLTKEAEVNLSPSVAFLHSSFSIDWNKESPLGNLLAEGIKHWVGADLAMVNSGQILFSLPKGYVSKRDLLAVCPHPINPCRIDLTGEAIRQILEQSLMEHNIKREIRGFGFRGKVLGWMCVDGITIYYDQTRSEGERIINIEMNGETLQEKKVYSIGTIDMFTFSSVYPLFREAKNVEYYLPEFIRDVLGKELQSERAIDRSYKNRWVSLEPKKERSS